MNNKNKKKMVAHGYWEWRYLNGKVRRKFTLNNGIHLGYDLWFNGNGKIECKRINI